MSPVSRRVPAVSIGIPVYNAGAYIETCARSLFSQTLEMLEFVFVDDGGTDDSFEIIERVLNDFPERRGQVRILRPGGNHGPLAARLAALGVFTGEYASFCDADDFLEPEMYEKMYAMACASDADVVHCPYDVRHVSGKTETCLENADITDIRAFRCGIASLDITPFLFTLLFRRDAVSVENCFLPPHVYYAEDLLLISQLLRQCRTVACCTDKGYYHYIRRPSSMSHGNSRRNFRNKCEVLRFLDRTEDDPLVLEARRTNWRNFLYASVRSGLLSRRRRRALLRHCGRGVLSDRRLKLKKRLRLFLWYAFPCF